MLTEDQQSLVQSWLTFKRHWWAFDALDDLCRDNPEKAWLVVAALVDAADTEELLGAVGAGRGRSRICCLSTEPPSLIERKLRYALMPNLQQLCAASGCRSKVPKLQSVC